MTKISKLYIMDWKLWTLIVVAAVLFFMRSTREGACPSAKAMTAIAIKESCDKLGGVVKDSPNGASCECPDGSPAV